MSRVADAPTLGEPLQAELTRLATRYGEDSLVFACCPARLPRSGARCGVWFLQTGGHRPRRTCSEACGQRGWRDRREG